MCIMNNKPMISPQRQDCFLQTPEKNTFEPEVHVERRSSQTRSIHLEGDLLALEVTETSTVGGRRAVEAAATTATATTASTAVTESTTASAATATTSVLEASTATATATAEATTLVGLTGGRVVETNVTAIDIGTVHGLKSTGGLLGAGELDVSVTLGGAGVTVGGNADGVDGTVLAEVAGKAVLGGVERKVAGEESGRGNALLVAVLCGTVVGAVATILLGLTRRAEIDSQGTAIELDTVLGVEGLDSGIDVGKLNVGETLGATRVGVGDDTDGDGGELLELTAEPVLVDVPGKTTDEEDV